MFVCAAGPGAAWDVSIWESSASGPGDGGGDGLSEEPELPGVRIAGSMMGSLLLLWGYCLWGRLVWTVGSMMGVLLLLWWYCLWGRQVLGIVCVVGSLGFL